jgi:NAD+ synthase
MPVNFALVQYNFNVGFIVANAARIELLYKLAATTGADLVVFSEMAITGYPAEDIVLSPSFQQLSMEMVSTLALLTEKGPAILVGGIWKENGELYNAAFLLDGGRIAHRQYKHHLPNYGVFDDKRLFTAGPMPEPILWRGIRLGILICEDMWKPDVATHLKHKGAEILICINASPFESGKARKREAIARARVSDTGLPLIYVNPVGGQDELVFDGGSFAVNTDGTLALRLKSFQEELMMVKYHAEGEKPVFTRGSVCPELADEEAMYGAMVLGLRDFVNKNSFNGIILGMSGGIDSALCAAIAVDAVGKSHVHGVMLPSPVTSRESVEDAMASAAMLDIRLDEIPLAPAMQALETMLNPFFEEGAQRKMASETNHPRLRGHILMTLCTKNRSLLLNTGNKSEMATGYTTIYGDMCGHYAVLKDVYKTTIYKLAEWRNANSNVIPLRSITKPPSAELHVGQQDQDILPPYALLDDILFKLIEERLSLEEIVAQGFDYETVKNVCVMFFASEYKRRQAAPGVKISSMSMGRDRRYPLTSSWWAMQVELKH